MQPVGYFRIWRELYTKPIWLKSTLEQQVILMTLIPMANFLPKEWEWKGEKYKVNAGQFVTSLESIRLNTGGTVSIQNIRTALKRFEKLEFLTNESTKEGRLITIVNWLDYQYIEGEPNIATNKDLTKTQQRPNKDLTPREEGNKEKKEKKVKEVKIIYRELVKMTEIEFNKLITEYGDAYTKIMLDKLDDYKASTGKKYDSDYRTILNWIKKDAEKEDKNGTSNNVPNKFKHKGLNEGMADKRDGRGTTYDYDKFFD